MNTICLGLRVKASNGHPVFWLFGAAHPSFGDTLWVSPFRRKISIPYALQPVVRLSLEDVNLFVDPCCRCVNIFHNFPGSVNTLRFTASWFCHSLIVAKVLCAFDKIRHLISLESENRVQFAETSRQSILTLNGSTL